jgi:LysM repeat protein
MSKNFRFCTLATITALVLSACTLTSTPTSAPPDVTNKDGPAAALELVVSADTSVPFNTVNQIITYSYLIRNTGGTLLAGPATVADDKATTSCPDLTTVGNLDANLDPTEQVTCTGTYAITQADLDAGSVTNNATATVGGINSNPASHRVEMTKTPALTLSKAANPTSYSQAGQIITYTYVIINSGNASLAGPFSIADDKAIATCPNVNTVGNNDDNLDPNEAMSCTATYTITQADLLAVSVTNNASASNGTITSANVAYTLNRSGSPVPVPPPVSGGTRQHTVVEGEWLWQIARCYGADPREVINANPQYYHHAILRAGVVVTVPNVGSKGTIYHDLQSCVTLHTVLPTDTWESIAGQYSNVDVRLLKKANPRGLFGTVKVPVGPYDYP